MSQRVVEKDNRKKSKVMPIISSILFMAGACIFFYPTVSNYIAEKNQASVIQEYQETVQKDDIENVEAEWAKAEEYNENLAGDPVHDPFVPGSGYALPENYLDVLNVNGIMGYIEIPKISVYLPIYHGTSEEVLEKGVGHIESTSLPIGGQYRHSVLTGHRGLPSAELFTNLDKLKEGDYFYIHVLDQTLAYKVDQIKTVQPRDLEDLVAVPGEDYITLVTCTPYAVNTHRLLVRGSRTDYVPPEETTGGETANLQFVGINIHFYYIGIGIGLVLLIAAIVIMKKKKWFRKR
ncbi:MAG: class C sortase [Lachnoclostridium sp.]